MRYIKKIDVTPVIDEGGRIVDSFGTNDNPKTNAPSLNAISENFDNNLLYDGLVVSGFAEGWTVDVTTGTYAFMEINGFGFYQGFQGMLKTPRFVSRASYPSGIGSIDDCFSITILYSIGYSSNTIKTAKLENIVRRNFNDYPDIINESGVVVRLSSMFSNCNFSVSVTGASIFYLKGVKVEIGQKATNFMLYGKDSGISDVFRTKLGTDTQRVLPNNADLDYYDSAIRVGKWLVNVERYSYRNLPSGMTRDGYLTVMMTEIGAMGFPGVSGNVAYECTQVIYEYPHDGAGNIYYRSGKYNDDDASVHFTKWIKFTGTVLN